MSRARFLDGVNTSAVEAGMIDPAQWKCELGTGGLRLGLGLWLGSGAGGGGGPTPPASVYSMNMSSSDHYLGGRPFVNLALGGRWNSIGGAAPLNTSNMTLAGELTSLPTGVKASRPIQNPNANAQRVRAWWKGPTAGMSITGGASIDPIVTSGAWRYIEYTHNYSNFQSNTISASLQVDEALIGGVMPTEIFIAEAASWHPDTAPRWHPDYVSWMAGQPTEYLRFMDWMDTNSSWPVTVTWAGRGQGPGASGIAQRTARLNITAGSDTLQIFAQEYCPPADYAYFAARTLAPINPFYSNGNSIAIVINPPGAKALTVDATVPGEVTITITPDSTIANPGSVGNIAAQIHADATAARWIDSTSTGTTAVGAVAKTFLNSGQEGPQGGIPVEWMVELCVLTGKKPWFCTPFRANDDYITQFFTYVNVNLPAANRPAIHEDHNETWNPGFKIENWLQKEAVRTGKTTAVLRGENHIRVMTLSRAACPDVLRTLSYQNYNTGDLAALLAVPNIANHMDIGSGAIYIGDGTGGGNAVWTTPTASTDPAVISQRVINTIPNLVSRGVTNKNALTAIGKLNAFYEFNQGIYGGAPTLADMQTWQRDPLQRRIIGIFLSECDRLGLALKTRACFMNYYPISNLTGSWGFHESQLTADADSPKWQAVTDAIDGLYPGYYDLSSSITLTSSSVYVGTPVGLNLPTGYNIVSTAYNWRANGGAVGGTNGNATYTPVAGDLGKTLDCVITVTGTNGVAFSYTSPSSTAVQASTKWKVIRNSDLVGGTTFTVPSDWNSSSNKIYLLGNGGKGFTGGTGNSNGGGGSGGFARQDNVTLTPGASVAATIGTNASPGVTAITSLVATFFANPGSNATGASGNAAAGGTAATGGGLARNGSAGGSVTGTFHGSSGGAGAPGPDGVGGTGSAITSGSSGTGGGGANGGANAAGGGSSVQPGGNNRFGTGAGTAGAPAGGAGSNGGGGGGGGGAGGHGGAGGNEIYFTDSVTSVQVGFGGGGGGSGDQANSNGGAGGWGAGGGGNRTGGTQGAGGDGWIVLEWNP